jgi:hypothetical protein
MAAYATVLAAFARLDVICPPFLAGRHEYDSFVRRNADRNCSLEMAAFQGDRQKNPRTEKFGAGIYDLLSEENLQV